jgi:hypothetical protein
MTREREVTLMPCLHAIFCAACTRGLTRCPACDAAIAGQLVQRLS